MRLKLYCNHAIIVNISIYVYKFGYMVLTHTQSHTRSDELYCILSPWTGIDIMESDKPEPLKLCAGLQ